MAAPMVSGAAALLLQKEPGLTPDQVKARLMKTACKAFPATSTAVGPLSGEAFTSQYVGAGYLDVVAALNKPDVANCVAFSSRPFTTRRRARCNPSLTRRRCGARRRCGDHRHSGDPATPPTHSAVAGSRSRWTAKTDRANPIVNHRAKENKAKLLVNHPGIIRPSPSWLYL